MNKRQKKMMNKAVSKYKKLKKMKRGWWCVYKYFLDREVKIILLKICVEKK
jgi:hypothetical protein